MELGGTTVEESVGQGAADTLVKEDEHQSNPDAFFGELVGEKRDSLQRAPGGLRPGWGDGNGHSARHRRRRAGGSEIGAAARPTLQQNRVRDCRTIEWALAGGSPVQFAAGAEDVRRGPGANRRL